MSKEIDRVPSSVVPLNTEEQVRFEGLAEEAIIEFERIVIKPARINSMKPYETTFTNNPA